MGELIFKNFKNFFLRMSTVAYLPLQNSRVIVFDSHVKWPFLAPRTGNISSYSCPFALVPSRIDSPKCPIPEIVIGFIAFFIYPKAPTMRSFFLGLKRPKNRPKMVESVPRGPKRYQSDAKMIPLSEIGSTQRMVENHPKMTYFPSSFVHFWTKNQL